MVYTMDRNILERSIKVECLTIPEYVRKIIIKNTFTPTMREHFL